MPVQIRMPALSPTMTEGNLVSWRKAVGDEVKAGDVIAEIETDKATMEVEAVDEGTLAQILVPAGTSGVKVNSTLCFLLEEGEDAAALEEMVVADQPTSDAPVVSQVLPFVQKGEDPNISSTLDTGGRVIASPLARRLAKNHHVDLKNLEGSGPRGRIVKRDIEKAQDQHQDQFVSTGAIVDKPLKNQKLFSGFEPSYQAKSVSMMRKVIAQRLTESKQAIPHFYLSVSCELDALMAARATLNASGDVKISVNDMVVRACALALMAVPDVNVAWADDVVHHYGQADISVAVAIEGGLITPVLRGAETKGLAVLSAEIKELAGRAKAGKLKPEEFQGGTFCLSNLGMYGVESFSAIINPPQACILAVGAGSSRAVVKNGVVVAATVMTVTLSVDHRAVDGAAAAQFLKVLKAFIEQPVRMLL